MYFLSLLVTWLFCKRSFILPGSFILLCLAGVGPLMAQQITWSVSQVHTASGSTAPPATITYTISEDTTRIDSPTETVFIDYQAHRLFLLSKSDHSCLAFPFEGPHETLPIAQVQVAASEDRIRINDRLCVRKYIRFGADLAFSQMMVPPVIQLYGRNFTITTINYCVAASLTGLDFLLDTARKHRQIFLDSPLLRQIDPIGVMEPLQGFALQSEQMLPGGRLLSTLEDGPHVVAGDPKTLHPPQSCRVMP